MILEGSQPPASQSFADFFDPRKQETTKAAEKTRDEAAFAAFLAVAKNHPADNAKNSEHWQATILAFEQFILARKNPIPELPWLESRQVVALSGMPTCSRIPLPDWYHQKNLHESDATHSFGSIPYLPDGETLRNIPDFEWSPQSANDKLVAELIDQHVVDLMYIYRNHDPELYEAINAISVSSSLETRQILAKKYIGWAIGTSITGADMLRGMNTTIKTTSHFVKGNPNPSSMAWETDPDCEIYLPVSSEDIAYELDKLETELMKSLMKIVDALDHARGVESLDKEAEKLTLGFEKIIATCRWYREHGNEFPNFNTIIAMAYEGMMCVQQFINHPRDNVHQYYWYQNIATLLTGARPDTYYDNSPSLCGLGAADYLDAFMAVASCVSTASHTKQWSWLANKENRYSRPLFGDHRLPLKTPEQILATLITLYLRMPQWQKETYADLIEEILFQATKRIPDPAEQKTLVEPLLFVANSKDINRSPHLSPFDLTNPTQAERSQHTSLAIYFAQAEGSLWHQLLYKPTARAEVKVPAHAKITGWRADEFTINDQGFLVRKDEKLATTTQDVQKQENALINREESTQESFLTRLIKAPEVLAGRLGQETRRIITELLHQNEEAGSINAVGKLRSLLEKLLGKKLDEQSTDFIDILMQLGLLNAELTNLSSVDEETLLESIRRCQKDTASLKDLDLTTTLILLLASTGYIPRELLVELVFKSYESLQTLAVLEAVKAIEHLEHKKTFFFFKRKEAQPSTILGWRDELAEIIKTGREITADGAEYVPLADPKFIKRAKAIISELTTLIHNNHSYDISMKSTLVSIFTASQQEQFVARCAVDGQLVTAILKLISPELLTYYTTTYGFESLMKLEHWFTWLQFVSESAASSHGFNSSEFLRTALEAETIVADATGDFTYTLQPHQVELQTEPTAHMIYGKVTKAQIANTTFQKNEGHCITGGSSLVCDMALDADHLEYATLADPDNLNVLKLTLSDEGRSITDRLAALDKLIAIEPRWFAFRLKADFNTAGMVAGLEAAIQLAYANQRWGALLFCTNILSFAGYLPPELREKAAQLHSEFVRHIATFDEKVIEAELIKTAHIVTESDRQAIKDAIAVFQAELAKQQAEKKTQLHLSEQMEIKKTQRQAAARIITQNLSEISVINIQIKQEEDRAKANRQSIPLGDMASELFYSDIAAHTTAITTENSLGTTVNQPELLLETVKPKLGGKALNLLTTDGKGNRLTGDALDRRIQMIYNLVTKVGLEYGQRKLAAETNVSELPQQLSPVTALELEATAKQYAEVLVAGLQANAANLKIELPPYVFEHCQPEKIASLLAQTADQFLLKASE